MQDDTLKELITSTLDLHTRFGVQIKFKSAEPLLTEEVDELLEAAYHGDDTAHIAEECTDVFVTAIGVAASAGVTPAQLLDATRAVIAKNDSKTDATHKVNSAGKIARKTA